MAGSPSPFLAFFVLLLAIHPAQSRQKTGGSCKISGYLHGKEGHCNKQNGSDCCKSGKKYPQYRCSPRVTSKTPATMTINSFAKGGDGGGPSECTNRYYSDDKKVVALSTGWYNGGSRCGQMIKITAKGRSVMAKVVDECDSVRGCDSDHDYQPPCPYNVVDASPAVWKALGLNDQEHPVTWADA